MKRRVDGAPGARAALERGLAEALRADDPVAAMRALAEHPALDAASARALREADADGIHMQALLTARLRFERLVRGSAEADARFEADPARFAELFRTYHREVAPRAFFPQGEAALFAAWLAARAQG